jgi:large subunit ribosomal protein L1
MDRNDFIQALQLLKEYAPKRNFKQTVDLIINLKDLDLKKPEHQVELFIPLAFQKGKKVKVCCLVGPELKEAAQASCDFTITQDQFPKYGTDKKAVKKLAAQYDYFVAQANIMNDVAKAFGRVLGPRGRMPNPKAGCVIPPGANVKALVERLQKTVKVSAKTQPTIKAAIGLQDMPDDHLIENAVLVYKQVLGKLPGEESNVRSVLLKYTMSAPVRVGMPVDEQRRTLEAKRRLADEAAKEVAAA